MHREKHTELKQIVELVKKLPNDLLPHLTYEEQTVFPSIKALAAGKSPKNVENLLEQMRTDHDSVGEQLHVLRDLTKGFVVPNDACAKYKEMLVGLEALERDLHIHVHLENNVLLPRAITLAQSVKDR